MFTWVAVEDMGAAQRKLLHMDDNTSGIDQNYFNAARSKRLVEISRTCIKRFFLVTLED